MILTDIFNLNNEKYAYFICELLNNYKLNSKVLSISALKHTGA